MLSHILYRAALIRLPLVYPPHAPVSVLLCSWGPVALVHRYVVFILDIICYVQCFLLSVTGPVCVAQISLFGIFSDRFQCKINIYCCKIFNVER